MSDAKGLTRQQMCDRLAMDSRTGGWSISGSASRPVLEL